MLLLLLLLLLQKVAPFPGSAWLEHVAATSSSPFYWNGAAYTSVYEAILQRGPLAQPYRNINAYINSNFFSNQLAGWIVQQTGSLVWGHYLLTYLRSLVAANALYLITGSIFHYFCYWHYSAQSVWETRKKPSGAIIWNQIRLATSSLVLYAVVPCVNEYLIEQGYTRVYYTVDQIGGWLPAILYFILHFTLIEISLYWLHRALHANKFLYTYVHKRHHQYNTPATVSPWASFAFDPVDGILQAGLYPLVLMLAPIHYWTHMLLLFGIGVWSTFIHDTMDWKVEFVLGSRYHTLHHTHSICNYGLMFTFCDYVWGTLRVPVGPTGSELKHSNDGSRRGGISTTKKLE